MKNKIFLFPLALAVIFFSSIIIIFSPVGKKNIIKITPTSPPIFWKTYSNDQYGFEFQYPSNWIKENESTNQICFNSSETHFQTIKNGYDIDFCVSFSQNINGVINPYTTPSVTYEDLNDYYNKTSTNPAIEYQWSGLITVNNNNGYKYVSCGHGCYFGIIIENNKGIYEMEFITAFDESKLTDIQKQILSTFKFTDNNISTKCTTDKDCSSTSFCDYNSPGGMGPNGFVAGEPYGSQKCILKCQSDDQCPSGQCQNFEIVIGDILDHVKGCKP